ncbi:unnamed protein product [Sphagnum jensenii]
MLQVPSSGDSSGAFSLFGGPHYENRGTNRCRSREARDQVFAASALEDLEDLSRSSCSFVLGVLDISEELMDVKEIIV